jgi:UDP-3-O-[3-hydroxymyristoyl] N-acetylglucosamine deacetylase
MSLGAAVAASVRLEGHALHAGTVTAVTLTAHAGPILLGRGDLRVHLSALRTSRTDFGVAVTDDRGFEVDLVEHFLAALGGLGIRRGVLALVEGSELPILDGGARRFADALVRLELPETPPELAVVRPGRLDFENGSYEFSPGDGVSLTVETSFDHPAIGRQRASWNGSPRTFRDDIAPARTFGFVHQARELARNGRAGLAAAASADASAMAALREAVIIFDEPGSAPLAANDEIARHKLLDLIGDLALYGGPPSGSIVARQPGHTATHRVVRRALDCGILSRR